MFFNIHYTFQSIADGIEENRRILQYSTNREYRKKFHVEAFDSHGILSIVASHVIESWSNDTRSSSSESSIYSGMSQFNEKSQSHLSF